METELLKEDLFRFHRQGEKLIFKVWQLLNLNDG